MRGIVGAAACAAEIHAFHKNSDPGGRVVRACTQRYNKDESIKAIAVYLLNGNPS